MSYLDPHHINRKNSSYIQRKGQTIPARLVNQSPYVDRNLVPTYFQYIKENNLLPPPAPPQPLPVADLQFYGINLSLSTSFLTIPYDQFQDFSGQFTPQTFTIPFSSSTPITSVFLIIINLTNDRPTLYQLVVLRYRQSGSISTDVTLSYTPSPEVPFVTTGSSVIIRRFDLSSSQFFNRQSPSQFIFKLFPMNQLMFVSCFSSNFGDSTQRLNIHQFYPSNILYGPQVE